MAQGKLKVKTKVPKGVKVKKTVTKKPTGIVAKRANKPIQPKKKESEEAKKLKQIITRTINKAAEDEIRSMATSSSTKVLSKAQQAVAEHNSKS